MYKIKIVLLLNITFHIEICFCIYLFIWRYMQYKFCLRTSAWKTCCLSFLLQAQKHFIFAIHFASCWRPIVEKWTALHHTFTNWMAIKRRKPCSFRTKLQQQKATSLLVSFKTWKMSRREYTCINRYLNILINNHEILYLAND